MKARDPLNRSSNASRAATGPLPRIAPEAEPSAASPAGCEWPDGVPFGFHDEPGEHDPCYVVMPGGAMIAFNHDARSGVDVARAKFVQAACNAVLRAQREDSANLDAEPSAAFTPGPWVLEDDDGGHRIRMGDAITSPYDHETHNLIKYDHGCAPSETSGPAWEQYSQALANARLIAAAPDLLINAQKNLATMEWQRRRLREWGKSTEELDGAIEDTRAAIDKALRASPASPAERSARPSGNHQTPENPYEG